MVVEDGGKGILFHDDLSLPQFALLLLSWHFDDSGLVDDTGCSLSFLNDADNPGLVALLLLNVLKHTIASKFKKSLDLKFGSKQMCKNVLRP